MFNVANMLFKVIRENKILAKIFEFTVNGSWAYNRELESDHEVMILRFHFKLLVIGDSM